MVEIRERLRGCERLCTNLVG